MADDSVERKDEPGAVAIDDARSQLGDLVARADYAGERTVITRYGKPSAALVGMKDLERLRALDLESAA